MGYKPKHPGIEGRSRKLEAAWIEKFDNFFWKQAFDLQDGPRPVRSCFMEGHGGGGFFLT